MNRVMQKTILLFLIRKSYGEAQDVITARIARKQKEKTIKIKRQISKLLFLVLLVLNYGYENVKIIYYLKIF